MPSMSTILNNRLEIDDAVRTFVEKEVHDGKIRLEAVFPGEDLEIRLFKFQVLKDGVGTFRVDRLPEVVHICFP